MDRVTRLLGITLAAGLLVTACAPAVTVQPTAAPLATLAPAAATLAPAPTDAVPAPATSAPTSAVSAATPTVEAGAGASAIGYSLEKPWGLAFDAGGKLFVSTCTDVHIDVEQLFEIDPSGLLRVYAGTSFGSIGDGGQARLAKFYCTAGLAFDPAGNLYIADQGNNRIRRIEPNGMVSTVAGSGTGGNLYENYCCIGSFAGDGGPATAASLWNPTDIAFDQAGDLYIADRNNNRVRKVDPQGVITTVAGTGPAGFAGDGGPATAAEFNTTTLLYRPTDIYGMYGLGFGMSLAVDVEGNLYITDTGNARVRKVDAQGIITTIAGTGEAGFSGDGGSASAAQLASPVSLAFDAEGNLYIADGPSHLADGGRIRRIDRAGNITTIAGTGEAGNSGDGGPATAAALRMPAALAFDALGNLYFADYGNHSIRMIDKNGIITTVAG